MIAALAALALWLAVPTTASAIVLDVAPSTVRVGQEVTFTIWAPFFFPTNCMLMMDYGDGGGYKKVARCLSTSCTKIVKYTYSLPGLYTATARPAPTPSCAASGPKPPPSFSRTIKVKPPLVTLRVSPSPIRVPTSRSSVQRLTYRATSPALVDMLLKSTSGVFVAGGRLLATVNTPLNISMSGGFGTTGETLTIPARVLTQARDAKASTITYSRAFKLGTSGVGVASVVIQLASPLSADFRITSISLYFDNGRPLITVKRNHPNLTVNARLNYVGTGLLRARWLVDGRPTSLVSRHLLSAQGTVVLTSPSINSLPTFMTGSHRVSLEIIRPELGIRTPVASYFVTAAEFKPTLPIVLTSPEAEAQVSADTADFQWQPLEGKGIYLVEFLSGPQGQRLFAALTRQPGYRLPAAIWREHLANEKSLYWRVSKLAEDGQVTGSSQARPVHLTKPAAAR